jgi:hypothetical protein
MRKGKGLFEGKTTSRMVSVDVLMFFSGVLRGILREGKGLEEAEGVKREGREGEAIRDYLELFG